jgi:hypothetical protein
LSQRHADATGARRAKVNPLCPIRPKPREYCLYAVDREFSRPASRGVCAAIYLLYQHGFTTCLGAPDEMAA